MYVLRSEHIYLSNKCCTFCCICHVQSHHVHQSFCKFIHLLLNPNHVNNTVSLFWMTHFQIPVRYYTIQYYYTVDKPMNHNSHTNKSVTSPPIMLICTNLLVTSCNIPVVKFPHTIFGSTRKNYQYQKRISVEISLNIVKPLPDFACIQWWYPFKTWAPVWNSVLSPLTKKNKQTCMKYQLQMSKIWF